MPFMKNATIGVASGIGVGAVFYTLGGIASTIFPSITPLVMGIVGFGSALSIALIEGEAKDSTK